MGRKLGVLFIGSAGAIATTVIAGVLAIRRGLAPTTGMVTESEEMMGLDLVTLDNIYFGGWEIRNTRLSDAARQHGIVPLDVLESVQDELLEIPCYSGVTTNVDDFTKRVLGVVAGQKVSLRSAVKNLESDIKDFRERLGLDQVTVVNVSSTEVPATLEVCHWSLEELINAIEIDHPGISPSMIYTYAALNSGCSFINFTASTCAELPALRELAREKGVPIAGKDGKTGQTLYKTVLAPMFRARNLKLNGWYSTNILGNSDGAVLSDKIHANTKIESKRGVLRDILGYDIEHIVRIDYYRPRGDNKEAWDSIDFEGWLGRSMSMKINWQGSDSALAAPLIVDLARLVEFSTFKGEVGELTYLSLFFKSPYGSKNEISHDFFKQQEVLVNHLFSEQK
ncbi:Myo-inositol-1-phosphate synthase [Sporomusa ovata DSM 2662]|uniref:Inositol-1-phosphate synthase n=1 Tax=Sporomusa ovata TaxID=2378 RepID=A0A0U1L276_9FIRM|nr:inositol-3-phosphate synthase [Sporomusa ovata]EQB25217.1 Myo-inositol-1-phosphate synthase [Sporomusa ovata DSM 2662]CQR73780.1 Inositol-1-phosphate synthase [Sporomusa ovata]